jgi:hypothetical protein
MYVYCIHYKIKNIPPGIPKIATNFCVTLDEKLNWEHHTDMKNKKVNAGIAVIN